MGARRSISCRACTVTVTWFCLLVRVGSSPLSSVVHTWSGVGLQAVLPCTWGTQVSDRPRSPYIQWETLTHTVFERMGERMFQGESFRNRVDVPLEILDEGNCSLFFRDVQFSDAGIYESYLVVGENQVQRRIFLQSVQLLVFDHKLEQRVEAGKDLVLDLYTAHAHTLVFESVITPGWAELWQRGKARNRDSRLQENEDSLVIRGVQPGDSGTYRVVDSDGLALSTVKITVTDPVPTKSTVVQEKQLSVGSGGVVSPVLDVTLSAMLWTLVIFVL
ncbi:uncharacterized protein LOC125790068 isoform X1 [Astyanax mexicanus]|uniref:uncharacterized protein LOC125790068 isoform X1 n=1 Tax=Astyanax mexicanus TaxID=7994 RepID=UPI0020CB0D9A|nr:uncharacterized protein LOC125790068 isoform X1 [Astyanax mexicanus]